MLHLILTLSCLFMGIFGAKPPPNCKLSKACVTQHTSAIFRAIIEDDNNQLDPMHQKLIEGNFASVTYKIENTTTTGFKKCNVKSANLDFKKMIFDIDLYCPEFHLTGMYDINGVLMSIPVEGHGEYFIDTKAYDIKAHLSVSLKPEGEAHYLHIDNFSLDTTPLEGVVYKFKNLFNGNKALADTFHKFVNENWKAVANELQGPVFTANFKTIVKAANKFFKKALNKLEDYF